MLISGNFQTPKYGTGVFTTGLKGNGDASSFTSDRKEYGTCLTADGEAQLGIAMNVKCWDVDWDCDGTEYSIEVEVDQSVPNPVITYSTDGVNYSTKNPGFSDVGEHKVYFKVTAEGYADYLGEGKVVLARGKWDKPEPPVVSKKTSTSFTVKAETGQEYSLDGKTWQDSNTFTGLTPGQTYTVYARVKEDKNCAASDASKGTKVTLPEKGESTGDNGSGGDNGGGDESGEDIAPPIVPSQRTQTRHLKGTVAQKGKSLTVKWGTNASADSYEVTVWYCGDKKPAKPTKTVKGDKVKSLILTKLNKKAINTRKSITAQVVAKQSGKVVARSVVMHIAGSGSRKRTNAKAVTNVPNSVTLKVKGTKTLAPKTQKAKAKRQLLDTTHAPEFRIISSNPKVVKVSGRKLIALKKGSCAVYVCAMNGVEKRIAVTVK